MWQLATDFDEFEDVKFGEPNLPQIRPHFFVPPLADKPQNPIMDAIKLETMNRTLPDRRPMQTLPPELAALTADLGGLSEVKPMDPATLWASALIRPAGTLNDILSWDRLRPTHSTKASPTAFLSEQDELVSASARYYNQGRVSNPKTKMVYVTQNELMSSLKMTVIGTSSTLYTWDASGEMFKQVGLEDGQQGCVLVDGKDEIISSSVIARFLTIGTLLRRLEEFIKVLRLRSSKEGPTVHAFTHSLSATLVYLRESLARCSSSDDPLPGHTTAFSALWMKYSIYEETLLALSELYGRGKDVLPEDYPAFDPSPINLLSRIYQHLDSHLESQSPRSICAILAFILTSASREYMQGVGVSVGFGGQPPKKMPRNEEIRDQYAFDEDEEDEEDEDIFYALEQIESIFPAFFPKDLLDILPAAQKSLILLRKAQPDHPLLNPSTGKKSIRWIWKESEIRSTCDGSQSTVSDNRDTTTPVALAALSLEPPVVYKPELSQFQLFDMEPGSRTSESAFQVKDSSTRSLQTFIDAFPDQLPSITPTLSHLTFLVFRDLLDHAYTLSSTLLSLYMTSTGNLNFQSHLVLLRSYLLLTAPSFKSRLLDALFSDAGEYEIDTTAHSMSVRSLRRRASKKIKESKQPWAVGLSPNLLEREMWPPVGGDLSFFLRTVIVDSLDRSKDLEDDPTKQGPSVIDEAGWRLGFAIRDLPTGPGRDKWLNPLCMEALDFLYMDYKAPHPVEILISPDTLSKYQRVFAFVLRLLRVECAIKSVFRMTRSITNPLFPTLTKARKLLLHFRFIAQSFVSSLAGYVFDTAIGGNFDPFLSRLSSNPPSVSSASAGFSDVFELADAHSNLLDDVLSACLLRSGQKAVGELLRHSLELVLDFCVVVGELHRGRLKEYQAETLIEDLYRRFRAKMATFTKVLKGLVDKGPSSSKWSLEVNIGERKASGGIIALYHLLIRLDLGDWWSKSNE